MSDHTITEKTAAGQNHNHTRIYSLDLLKIIATIFIIAHHYQQITGAFFSHTVNFFGGKFYFGYMVELFFILSGFFMYGYREKIRKGMPFGKFFSRRIKRLLPTVMAAAVGYEVLLIIYTRILGENWMDRTPGLWGMIIDGLGLQDGGAFENPYVNNPTWYISVLLFCYFVFYLIVFLCSRLHVSEIWPFAGMIFLGASIRTSGISLPFLNEDMGRGYCAFFTGILLASFLAGRKIRKSWIRISLAVCVFFVICLIFAYSFISDGLNYLLTFIFYPALIILFLSDPVRMLLRSPFWGRWGEISFDAYIWHVPVLLLINVLQKAFSFQINYARMRNMWLFVLCVEAAAVCSHFLMEKLSECLQTYRVRDTE